MHMSGLFSNLKTQIYHVYVHAPVGNKHVYTFQLSWSLFIKVPVKCFQPNPYTDLVFFVFLLSIRDMSYGW